MGVLFRRAARAPGPPGGRRAAVSGCGCAARALAPALAWLASRRRGVADRGAVAVDDADRLRRAARRRVGRSGGPAGHLPGRLPRLVLLARRTCPGASRRAFARPGAGDLGQSRTRAGSGSVGIPVEPARVRVGRCSGRSGRDPVDRQPWSVGRHRFLRPRVVGARGPRDPPAGSDGRGRGCSAPDGCSLDECRPDGAGGAGARCSGRAAEHRHDDGRSASRRTGPVVDSLQLPPPLRTEPRSLRTGRARRVARERRLAVRAGTRRRVRTRHRAAGRARLFAVVQQRPPLRLGRGRGGFQLRLPADIR